MTRPLRLEFPGALWHVHNRGVERRSIFLDDHDRRAFLCLLEKTIEDHGWRMHAYVLMSNHYHLFFETPAMNLSRGMKALDASHAASFNQRHQRVGHLFQSRFSSHLVDGDTYFLVVSRYVVLNPVRARIVSGPAEWPWSSYKATAGLASVPAWLDPAPILDRFNRDNWVAATIDYRQFVAAGIGDAWSPWDNLTAQAFLGDQAFLKRVEKRVEASRRSREHLKVQREFRARTLDDVRAATNAVLPKSSSDSRSVFIVLASRHTRATQAAIGRAVGVTGQAVGKIVRTCTTNATVAGFVEAAERHLLSGP
jgi:REP element-mobilizing transposase RayT